jgi:CoA:oxalate CoA-transferase
VQAEVGRVELDARLRNAPMEQSPHVDGDITPGLLAVSGIVAALFRRERTGAGDHVDVSMAEALLYTDEWTSTELAGYEGPRIPDTWNYPVFTLADGAGVAFMGDPHPRVIEVAAALTDAPIRPTRTRDESLELLGELIAGVADFATLEARLDPFGFLVAEVRTVRDVAATPWAVERAVFDEVEPGATVPARPFRVRNSTVGAQGRAPRLAEHTREVLAERLGLDEAALDELEAGGVVTSTARPDDGVPATAADLARIRAARSGGNEV